MRGPASAVLRLAWASVRRRPLPSILTGLSVALAIALVIAVDTLRASAERSYADAARGYDVVLGPPAGSPLQTVLSTLFHVDVPYGTLSWSVYADAQEDQRVAAAVPYAIGDTYRGHRVVGTTAAMFEVLDDAEGRALGDGLAGRMFAPEGFEAVVGSLVARATGLRVGATFRVTHGLGEVGSEHTDTWTVVGVLRPTATPHDRAVYIPIETFYEIEGHEGAHEDEGHDDDEGDHDGEGDHGDEDHGDEDHGDDEGDHDSEDHGDEDHGEEEEEDHGDEEDHDSEDHGDEEDHDEDEEGGTRQLSAVAVKLASRNPRVLLAYLQEFRTKRSDAQAALPTDQVRKLMDIVGNVDRALRFIAWLVAVVAAVGILVGLYNTIQGRRREIAVLRALGAHARHVFAVILLEALLLCALGGLLGLLLGHAAIAVAAPYLLESYGILARPAPGTGDLAVLAILMGLGVLAGILPAYRGLATPVAANLHPQD